MVTSYITPDYQVKYYREGFYKVIRFDVPRLPRLPGERKGDVTADKLSQALSRAKSVIQQVAICNDWDYFFTCTLDPEKWNRFDIDVFRCKFPQWIRDYNKKHHLNIKYLIVPERHKDGAVHIHGFIRGLPEYCVSRFVPFVHPHKLVEGAFFNWSDCSKKFGFCSLAPIRDPIAVGFYVCKYLTKDLARDFIGYGSHLYYCSLGLNRAVPLGYVYGRAVSLDRFLDCKHEFCSTGYADEKIWDYLWHCYGPDEWLPDDPYVSSSSEIQPEIITNLEFEQLCMYLNSGGMV